MVGMAVGDALGAPLECLHAQDAPVATHFDLESFQFVGRTTGVLKPGQWTDDASMGLCLADSLLLKHRLLGSDLRVRLWCWWFRGYNNAFAKDRSRSASYGLGSSVAKSLAEMLRLLPGQAPTEEFQSPEDSSGVSCLTRCAPVSVFFHDAPVEELLEMARRSSRITHPGPVAAESCALLVFLMTNALRSHHSSVKNFLDSALQEYWEQGIMHKFGPGYDEIKCLITSTPRSAVERCWDWRSTSLDVLGTLEARGHSYNGYPVSARNFGSFAVDGLAVAIWSMYHTTSFDEAVGKAVNVLGDADSVGAIAGQLAGAFYGYKQIDGRFIDRLAQWDDYGFACRAAMLLHLGATTRYVATML